MRFIPQIVFALIVALVVGFGYRAFDLARGAEWVVSPQQIAKAKSEGKLGVETQPGSIAVLPIRDEVADFLPYKWTFTGVLAGYLAFSAGYMLKRKRLTIRITRRQGRPYLHSSGP